MTDPTPDHHPRGTHTSAGGPRFSHAASPGDIEIETRYPVTRADLERLRSSLTRRASGRELIDVAYRLVDSPVGRILLATTPAGLVRVAYEVEGFDAVLGELADRLSPRLLHAPRQLDRAATQFGEYFAGGRRGFELPLDHSLSAGFRLSVHRLLPDIGYGRTCSYREVAEAVGNPRAVRAVGTACARNPLPVVVPCHRVLRSDGGLGGYIGGAEAKRRLLALERDTAATTTAHQ